VTQHIGERFGHYRLIRFLGEGTFGDVYYGEHVSKKTSAAIKVFKNKLTPDKFRSFLNEVRTVLLKHPNIVEILDFGVADNDLPYLVMAYAPKGTLLQRYPRGTPQPITTVVPYVKQLASALQYAHDQSIIHRDVKPENMLFGPNDELLLSDFGLAVVVHSTLSRPAEDKSGTALYMAPEQWQGKPLPATDQYALGMVVCEWLCGEHPFSGGVLQLMYQHLHVSPPSLRDKLTTISPEVEQVVMTALAKDPGQRFKRVQAFAIALEEASKSGLPLPPKSTIILPPPATPPVPPRQQ
jgi:eukaryotic-like serine/threonine-protein kinase